MRIILERERGVARRLASSRGTNRPSKRERKSESLWGLTDRCGSWNIENRSENRDGELSELGGLVRNDDNALPCRLLFGFEMGWT